MEYIFAMITFLAIVIYIESRKKKKEEENKTKIKSLGYDPDSKIKTGKFVGGHPEIDENRFDAILFPLENSLEVIKDNFGEFKKKGTISFESINNVLVEDQTTIEKRITMSRMLTVGLFAFAWKKKEKKELAYLTIEWNDGKFDHSTIFEFDNFQKANSTRNQIIRIIGE